MQANFHHNKSRVPQILRAFLVMYCMHLRNLERAIIKYIYIYILIYSIILCYIILHYTYIYIILYTTYIYYGILYIFYMSHKNLCPIGNPETSSRPLSAAPTAAAACPRSRAHRSMVVDLNSKTSYTGDGNYGNLT